MVFITVRGKDKRKKIVLFCQELNILSHDVKHDLIYVNDFTSIYVLTNKVSDVDFHIFDYNAVADGWIRNVEYIEYLFEIFDDTFNRNWKNPSKQSIDFSAISKIISEFEEFPVQFKIDFSLKDSSGILVTANPSSISDLILIRLNLFDVDSVNKEGYFIGGFLSNEIKSKLSPKDLEIDANWHDLILHFPHVNKIIKDFIKGPNFISSKIGLIDGTFGFEDFKNIVLSTDHNEKKGVICLGGSISKHHAILATLLNGGAEYAVYMTTAQKTSGSMSGATTQEAKSWGKVKDESDIATFIGDVTIMFPLAMIGALEELSREGIVNA